MQSGLSWFLRSSFSMLSFALALSATQLPAFAEDPVLDPAAACAASASEDSTDQTFTAGVVERCIGGRYIKTRDVINPVCLMDPKAVVKNEQYSPRDCYRSGDPTGTNQIEAIAQARGIALLNKQRGGTPGNGKIDAGIQWEPRVKGYNRPDVLVYTPKVSTEISVIEYKMERSVNIDKLRAQIGNYIDYWEEGYPTSSGYPPLRTSLEAASGAVMNPLDGDRFKVKFSNECRGGPNDGEKQTIAYETYLLAAVPGSVIVRQVGSNCSDDEDPPTGPPRNITGGVEEDLKKKNVRPKSVDFDTPDGIPAAVPDPGDVPSSTRACLVNGCGGRR